MEETLYRVELIFRQSCINDIKKFWKATGRTVTADEDGQAVFENVTSCEIDHGVIIIYNNKNEAFAYNMSDFYRLKKIEQK